MKAKIHPKYNDCAVTCGCGAKWTTRSVLEKINVEICSSCHPFYTGRAKFVDTAGRIERFQKKYGWSGDRAKQEAAATKKATKATPAPEAATEAAPAAAAESGGDAPATPEATQS